MSLKNTILLEAMDFFEQNGIEAFTEKELRKKLDISEATFTSFFRDKEDMLVQAYEQKLKGNIEEHQRIIRDAANPVEEIFGLIDNASRNLLKVSPAFITDIVKYPVVMEILARHSEEYSYPLIYEILNKGVLQGYFRKEINLGIVTRVILQNVYLLLNTRVFPPDSFSAREIFRNIYLYYLRGLCTKDNIGILDRYFS